MMRSVVIVGCATAICYGLRGWWVPMWFMLMVASVVAAADLFRETET